MILFIKMGLEWFEEENQEFIVEHVNCEMHVSHPSGGVKATVGGTAWEAEDALGRACERCHQLTHDL